MPSENRISDGIFFKEGVDLFLHHSFRIFTSQNFISRSLFYYRKGTGSLLYDIDALPEGVKEFLVGILFNQDTSH